MNKNNDLTNLGDIYKDVLNQVVVTEDKVPVGEIGNAELEDGGPTEKAGFKESEIDITKMKKGENKYNVRGYSYGDDEEDPGLGEDKPQPTSGGTATAGIVGDEEDEESEESSKETEKIVQDSLNNFMATKSVFDKLYDKVMVNENFPYEGNEDMDELDALGLDNAEPDADGEEGEITVTLDRDMAQALCDVLQAAIGDEAEADDAPEDGDGFSDSEEYEEDEEGSPTTLNTHYNDGKNNKVGNLRSKGAASAKGAGSKVDAGSAMNTHYNDGKNNKVGNLKAGQSAFE